MQLKQRIKKIENKLDVQFCGCGENVFAASTSDFEQTRRCRKCGRTIKPCILLVKDLSEIECFTLPVKIYAGIDASLV